VAQLREKGVFPNQHGGPMHRDNLSKRHIKLLLEKAGLPTETRLYDLRHTFSTLWRESGEPLDSPKHPRAYKIFGDGRSLRPFHVGCAARGDEAIRRTFLQ